MIELRQSTAGQEVPLGFFLDSTDGDTEETGLTISNTDIWIWKWGATTLADKNSGGGTHMQNGVFYAVLDATDTDTLGPMVIFVHESGALTVRLECAVLPANVWDAKYSTDKLEVDVAQWLGTAAAAPTVAGVPEVDLTHVLGHLLTQTGTQLADGIEKFFDVGTPTGTVNSLPGAAPDGAGGLTVSDAGGLDMDAHVLSARTTGYAGGAVWVDTDAANTNTVSYVDGVADNPVSTIAAAKTIADALGLKIFHLVPGSSITLAAAYDDYIFDACHATIALGGQSINNSVFIGAIITGDDDGSNANHVQYFDCVISTNTLGLFVMTRCYFAATLTLAEAGTYYMHQCFSGVAGTSTPGLDFGAGLGASNVNMRDYSGGIEIENMGAGAGAYNMSLEGNGQLVINANCSATSTVAIRGNFTVTDNAGGAVTLSDNARYDTTQVLDALVDDSTQIDASALNTHAAISPATQAQSDRNAALIESEQGRHTWQGNLFYVDPVNGDTHANGNRGGRNDPYAGIQDCHDNAIVDSNHDVIILVSGAAAGATTLTEDVTLSKRYLFIRGPGRDFIWTRSDAGDTISITADGIELSGFQLNTAGAGSGSGIQVTDADFESIHNLWINNTRGDGINLLRSTNCVIHDNVFENSGVSGSGQGVDIVGTAGSSNSNVIEDNTFIDVSGDAIQISGGTTNNTIIRRNQIEGSSGWGIDIGASSTDAVVRDNRFGNNASGSINDGGTTTILINNDDYDVHLDTLLSRLSAARAGYLDELAAANLPADVDTLLTRITAAVALASICTEARLAELDAANLPTDIAAIPTTAMRGTDNAATETKQDIIDGIVDAILVDTGTSIPVLIAALENISVADVNAQVSDVIKTDTYTLPGQEAPTETPTLEEAIMYIFKLLLNKRTNDGSNIKIFARDEVTVDQKNSISDAGGVYTHGEFGTGP